MKYLCSQILILLVFLLQVKGYMSPHTYQTQSTSFYQCLRASGYDWITSYIASDSKQLSSPSIQGIYNAKNAGLDVELVIQVCRGISPEQQAQMVLMNVIPTAYSRVWALPTFLSADKNCIWQQTYEENCQYMIRFKNQMQKYNKMVGFAGDVNLWTSYFGSSSSCPQLGAYPLLWAPFDKKSQTPTFDDFKPFGGWIMPTLKQYGSTTLCGKTVELNFYIFRGGSR